MEYLDTTKQGNMYFLLRDKRIGIVYPKTGMVRITPKDRYLNRQNLYQYKMGIVLRRINRREQVVQYYGLRTYKQTIHVPCKTLGEALDLLRDYETKNCKS